MQLEFHRLVTTDISQIMDYYEGVAGPKLADDFYIELRSFFQKAARSPEAYDICEDNLRRGEPRKISIPFSIPYRPRPGARPSCSSPPQTAVAGPTPAMTVKDI